MFFIFMVVVLLLSYQDLSKVFVSYVEHGVPPTLSLCWYASVGNRACARNTVSHLSPSPFFCISQLSAARMQESEDLVSLSPSGKRLL